MSLYKHTHTPVHSGSHMFIFWPIPLLMPACNSQTQQSVGFVAAVLWVHCSCSSNLLAHSASTGSGVCSRVC